MDGPAHKTTPETFPRDTSDHLARALGDAVLRLWGTLPPALQNLLFREAVTSTHNEVTRPQLAVFLHNKHPRTVAAKRAGAIIEPDSLGG
jgi:hypothetical protein